MNPAKTIHIAQINAGNQQAYRLFFDRNFLLMCQFAERFLDDVDATKDVVQEAFIRAWELREEFEDLGHLKGYLYKIIRNKCLNIKRNALVAERNKDEIQYLSSEKFYRDILVEEEIYNFICRKIEDLPEMQRLVIKHHIDGLSNEEIAQLLHITPNTVRTHKQRAKATLKIELDSLMSVLIILHLSL
ncbi:MAG: RNA polymerase sigma factor [Mangrovibacterium sp.]